MIKLKALVLTAICLGLCAGLRAEDGPVRVRQVKVQPDKAPDCTSLKSIVQSITRDCKNNDEKAIAIYNFMQMAHYHSQYATENGGVGALKEINTYGWGLCGGLHAVQSALWREMGWKWHFMGWPGHTTVEVEYDNRWHYFDVFMKVYIWMPLPSAPGGRTVAGEEDIKQNPKLVENLVLDKMRVVYYEKDNAFEVIEGAVNWQTQAHLVCGDTPADVASGCKAKQDRGDPTAWAYDFDEKTGYTTDVNLAPGTSLTLLWKKLPKAFWYSGRTRVPSHSCGNKDVRNLPSVGPVAEPYMPPPLNEGSRSYTNGILAYNPDFSNPEFLKGLNAKSNVKLENGQLVPEDPAQPASITLALASPYVMTLAKGVADGADEVAVSRDNGKTFKAVQIADFSDAVGGLYNCLLKVTFKSALKSLSAEVTVQHNRGAAPYLSPGKNTVTVSVADPKELGDNKLVVTYAYNTGSRNRPYQQLASSGEYLARGKGATWSDVPTVVQKVFTAKDLPATFEIDIPTPKKAYPVYPRMLFMRREVIAANSKPLPLPEGAAEPKTGPDDELKTMPNPFMAGLTQAPPKTMRPVTTQKFELTLSHTVSKDGKTEPNHYIKSKEGEHWVALAGGELANLPAPQNIAAARVILPVLQGTQKAAMRAAVSLLQAPIEAGKPFDFAKLGNPQCSVIVPKHGYGGDNTPPKLLPVDFLPAVKQLASGEAKFFGLAIQAVQDRGVDEGYTVRMSLPKDAKIMLEIDVFADGKSDAKTEAK